MTVFLHAINNNNMQIYKLNLGVCVQPNPSRCLKLVIHWLVGWVGFEFDFESPVRLCSS